MSSFWDSDDRMVLVTESLKCALDFAVGQPHWIQQESTFWHRSLWEDAGGRLDESFRYMIDTDLWGRFFAHAQLHHVRTVLSGIRYHGENRSLVYSDACEEEVKRVVDSMPSRLPPEDQERATRLAAALKWLDRLKNVRGTPGHYLRQIARTCLKNSLIREYPVITNETMNRSWRYDIVKKAD